MSVNRARPGRWGGLGVRTGVLVSGALALLTAAAVFAADGDARLVEASRANDQQSVRRLLKQGADPNGRALDGSTALLWAAHWNDLESADLSSAPGLT
jgi:ankyrin repeat protein